MDEVKKVKISSLDSKIVQGPNGNFEVWIVNGKWEAGKGKWSAGWKIGEYARGVFKEVTSKTGKTYYKIGCPPELMPKQQFGGSGFSEIILGGILSNVKAIREHLIGAPSAKPESAEPEADEPDEPKTEEEVDVESIPF